MYSSALPCTLTAYGTLVGERSGEDRGAHHQVVGERDIGLHAPHQLAHGGHVGVDVALDLLFAAAREGARFDPLVRILDVHRQQPADLGPVGGAAHRLAQRAHPQLSLLPLPDGVDEGLALGVAVLAEQVHLVAEAHKRPREARVVDVGARAREQVAVEDQDAYGAQPTCAPPRRSCAPPRPSLECPR